MIFEKIEKQFRSLTQGQTKTYVYDLDGNMTTGFTPEGYPITMTYDAQNRMKSAEYIDGGSVTHRNEYNYAGNSLIAELKKYDAGALTATTKYLRSGFLPMQERDAANTVAREYTWGLNLGGGIGGLLNLRHGSVDYSYLYDGKGNVSALIDSSQNLVAAYAYDPFGQLMSKSGTLDQPFMFSTKEYDSRTGFSNYGYRFRDSCSGRWTTRDPLGERGGINLYRTMRNSPMNRRDPLGLKDDFPVPVDDPTGLPDWNGNLIHYFEDQDGICSSGAYPLNEFPSLQVCCIKHDKCFEANKCNATSWPSTLLPNPGACGNCDRAAVKCVIKNLPRNNDPSCDIKAP